MAMNLRLTADEAAALRNEAEQTGCSQQDIVRTAVDRHLAHSSDRVSRTKPPRQAQRLGPPRLEYRKVVPTIQLEDETTSLDLLERDDRI